MVIVTRPELLNIFSRPHVLPSNMIVSRFTEILNRRTLGMGEEVSYRDGNFLAKYLLE